MIFLVLLRQVNLSQFLLTMSKYLLLIFFLLLGLSTIAQRDSISYLRVFTSPASETLIIDNKKIERGSSTVVKSGEHRVRAWSPHHYPLDTVIKVEAGKIQPFYYNLKGTPEYFEHRLLSKKHFNRKSFHYYLPLGSTVALAVSSTATYFIAQNTYDEANQLWVQYLRQGELNIDNTYALFDEARDRYATQRTYFYVQTGALVLSAYLLYEGIKWTKNNKKPVPRMDKDPFLNFDSAFLTPTTGLNSQNGLALTMIFNIN